MAETLTVEEKLAKVVIDLRQMKPLGFYSAVWETIKKVQSTSIKTIGVSSNTLTYNPEFVDNRAYKQFLFIALHEIGHIALMHSARRGNRHPELWNIACDLYVNSMICKEINSNLSQYSKMIEIPTDMQYTDTLDTSVEIVDDIYDNLYEQAKYNGYLVHKSINNDGTYYFEYTGKLYGKKYETILFDHGAQGYSACPGDLVNNGDDENQQMNDARQIVTEAKTRHEMRNSDSSSTDAGAFAGRLEALVSKLLESKIDWRKLLRKYCIQYVTKDISYKTPDKRMYYQSAIYPGLTSESEEILKDVKVCIDTSGSMSDTDLAYVMGQVKSLMNTYKTKAEVLSWDTEVEGSFEVDSDISNIKKSNTYTLYGRGGTDPKCLFEYFDSPKCKVKPFVTLIFTDGYFGDIELTPRQKRLYKNTIWIMTREYNVAFKPPVGKIAYAKFSHESADKAV